MGTERYTISSKPLGQAGNGLGHPEQLDVSSDVEHQVIELMEEKQHIYTL